MYIQNGRIVSHPNPVYCPDVVHTFAIDFIRRHKDEPFFVYYAPHFVHVPLQHTPDSRPGRNDPKSLYADSIAYLDKQVGLVVKELEALKLREKTLIVFSGDNGTLRRFAAPIGGRTIQGSKGQLLEGGSRVPLIANWKGVTPEGKVPGDLIDFSDIYATFAQVAGARLPETLTFDSHSFAPQLRGQAGKSRDWVYVQLGNHWYARSRNWKLTENGELFDMTDAPFVEKPVENKDAKARAGQEELQKVLDNLNPASGKTARRPAPRGGQKMESMQPGLDQ
jgi:arylsulfatase A